MDSSEKTVEVNAFWVEWGEHILSKGEVRGFLSRNFQMLFSGASTSVASVVLGLSACDLQASEYALSAGKDRSVTLEARRGSVLTFWKQMDEVAGESEFAQGIQLYQRYFDPRNRYRYSEQDPDIEEVVRVDEFIQDRLYGCQVIITNSSVSGQQVNMLLEVPNGAVPVYGVDYQSIKSLTL